VLPSTVRVTPRSYGRFYRVGTVATDDDLRGRLAAPPRPLVAALEAVGTLGRFQNDSIRPVAAIDQLRARVGVVPLPTGH
jgi:hypothetical protein